MKKYIFLLLSTVILASCYTTQEEIGIQVPDDLIPRDKLVLILADIEIIESAIRDKQNFGHEIADLNEAYYASTFKFYEVSRDQFESSMKFYKQDLDLMNDIYEDVITRLSVIESEIQHE